MEFVDNTTWSASDPSSRSHENASNQSLPKVVSLFSGVGGLDLGFVMTGFVIPVAFDISAAAIKSHRRNFKDTDSIVADLTLLKPEGVLAHVKKNIPIGERIGVIGGPPCQGFSRANTGAQTDDPRNQLPALYLEIVKELQKIYIVEFVIMENVLGIRDKKHVSTYRSIVSGLFNLGFQISEHELCAINYGVPQNRKRVIISGMYSAKGYKELLPKPQAGKKTVFEAIGGLVEPAYFKRNLNPNDIPYHPNHWTMQPKSRRFFEPSIMEKSGRSFRKLEWEKPSPTIAFGNREIPIHPNGHRRISVFEALVIQGFPEGFVLEGNFSEQAMQVSNAVPPPLARSLAVAVKHALDIV